MDTITTRRATAADAAVVAEVAHESYLPYVARMNGRHPAPMDADYAVSITHDLVWVAAAGDQVAGFLVLVDQPAHTHVESVAVRPDRQGRGIGRLLLEIAEDHARAAGMRAIRLYTNAAMLENQRLYSYLGYVETGRGVEDGFDRVFYEKVLDPTEKTHGPPA